MNTKRPFQVVERMRTAAKFKNMRNARAKHVKLLSSIITKLCKGVTFVIEFLLTVKDVRSFFFGYFSMMIARFTMKNDYRALQKGS